ncbi:MAG TPA: fatty acid desaturase [Candidatus Xenobia bacterium]|jgi:stearoyl-CoA desaturase (delta-9 desaturase)
MKPPRAFVVLMAGVHLAALAAVAMPTRGALCVCLFSVSAVQLAISLGYHRLISHRAYQARPWLRLLLAALAAQSMQGGPIDWATLHRLHHARSDQEGDPHSPRFSLWWGHLGWTFGDFPVSGSLKRRYCPDLVDDAGLQWVENHYVSMALLVAVTLYLVGGWPWLLWGGPVRVVLNMHATGMINSVAHRFGYRNHDTADGSRNHWLVALLTWGEGWHNNHHARPGGASFGSRWWELDTGFLCLQAWQKAGWAWDIE